MKRSVYGLFTAGLLLAPAAGAQTEPAWSTGDPVLQRIWTEGMTRSRVEPLAQALLDSIGPRLTGSPEQDNAHRWAVETYRGWGISARTQPYGTWRGWRRGYTHADLVQPRMRTLEATMLAWSPGTQAPVTGPVVAIPDSVSSADAFRRWLPSVAGKFVLATFPEPTCRPDENWARWAEPATFERMKAQRAAADSAWTRRMAAVGHTGRTLPRALEEAGAAGVLTNLWSDGWGVDKIFQARTQRVPTLNVSCEDYGLLHRLAINGQGPVIRVDARSEALGEVPASNTLAEIRGRALPNEYVVLSAHFDSWDGGSGATDNGTGTVVMMEAMRILKTVYPNPRRTILAGHWSGEEQGLNGSRGFVADNPEIARNVHVLFNQDNGTGRISNIAMQGFTQAEPFFRRWLAKVPSAWADSIQIDAPGSPSSGGSDHAAFVCAGAPAFMLSSLSWDYGTYTWHTNRDTYDKISWEDVRRNAVLVAMLAYLAAEEPSRIPGARLSPLPVNPQTGQPREWPACSEPARNTGQSTR